MRLKELKDLIKKSMLEVTPNSGAMTPEEEKMVADYEEEKANKYAVGPKEEPMEEASVTLNSDEVYAKYAPLVQKYKDDGMDKYQAIAQAEKDLARHYGATPMNIATFVDDYSKKQYMGGDEDSIDAFADEREHDVLREADDIVAAYAEKQTLKEEMHGGYLELFEMKPAFEEGVASLLEAWNEWKQGEMTEPEMIDEAKQDILAYLSSIIN
jgi:hypothetical protein